MTDNNNMLALVFCGNLQMFRVIRPPAYWWSVEVRLSEKEQSSALALGCREGKGEGEDEAGDTGSNCT